MSRKAYQQLISDIEFLTSLGERRQEEEEEDGATALPPDQPLTSTQSEDRRERTHARTVRISDSVAAKTLLAREGAGGRAVRERVLRLRESGHAPEGARERTVHIRDPRVKHNYESQDELIQHLRLLWRYALGSVDRAPEGDDFSRDIERKDNSEAGGGSGNEDGDGAGWGDGADDMDSVDGGEEEDSGVTVSVALPPSPLRAVIDHLRSNEADLLLRHPSPHDMEVYVFLLQDIERKRRGYFYQDAEKDLKRPGICNPARLVTLDDVVELLAASRGRCHYCDRNFLLYYEYSRCNAQWTLDRIDNEKGHWTGNCVASCLSCNISRGAMDDERFFAGKRLVAAKRDAQGGDLPPG
jgi:hypothetical protein